MMRLPPLRLVPSFRQRTWGSESLGPWFPAQKGKVGEVWFTSDDNVTVDGAQLVDLVRKHGAAFLGTDVVRGASGHFPILAKFIFTSDHMSVQVHPDDAYAMANHGTPGKTEMWHILRTGPGATLGLGLKEEMSREALRRAALSGEITSLLQSVRVNAGDSFLLQAGTVHTIGGGIVLCEIQQNSDVTYRLYDYGRPRELHLDRAIEVASRGPHPGLEPFVILSEGRRRLASCKHFETELSEVAETYRYQPDPERCHVLVVLAGSGNIAGQPFSKGQCWVIPASAEPFDLEPAQTTQFLLSYVPPSVD